ncbi:MAG: ATP-grasp domain-containing protein [Paracoccaceae bacterium]|nr:ATP-grasp domain-containing protein [Paracoccaceae bacterium]
MGEWMTGKTLYYIDNDRSENGLYSFQRQHSAAARALGYAFVSIVSETHPHPERSDALSDDVIALPRIDAPHLFDTIQGRGDAALLFTYPGQHAPGHDVHAEVAVAAAALRLPVRDPQSLWRCNDKGLMRATLEAAGVPSAAYARVAANSDLLRDTAHIPFPVIVKPLAGTGSALVGRCDTTNELKAFYAQFCGQFSDVPAAAEFGGVADTEGAALVEECLQGVEVTVECIVHENVPHALIVNEKLHVTYENATVLEHLLISPPLGLTDAEVKTVKYYAEDVLRALDLGNSMVHLELFLTQAGPRVVEVNPRVGGFEVPREFRDFLGIDPFEFGLRLLMGEITDTQIADLRARSEMPMQPHAMYVIYPQQSGYLEELNGVEGAATLPGVKTHSVHMHEDWIDVERSERFVAKFWAEVSSAQEALDLYQKTTKLVKPKMTQHASAQRSSVA